MTAVVLRGHARCLPLPDESVDLIVTSPPYLGLRDYRDGEASLAGQIGAESAPAKYIAALLDCTREWMRVLKPSGSMFVNLGDSYSAYNNRGRSRSFSSAADPGRGSVSAPGTPGGMRNKTLMGLPWRYALGCVDDLGLILRAEIIWSKPNGMPESVTDRVRRSHEQLFHLVKSPRYFSAVDEIRERGTGRGSLTWAERKMLGEPGRQGEQRRTFSEGMAPNPLGKLPGSVWEIASRPFSPPPELGVNHYAAFPMEIPRRCILGWSPAGICVRCGEGRRPVSAVALPLRQTGRMKRLASEQNVRALGRVAGGEHKSSLGRTAADAARNITGYACACPDAISPVRPAVVLDPFGGTGTTALVAHALGRAGITVDLSADYCRVARWRTTDRGQLATAMQVPKPVAQIDGQADLFEATGEAWPL